MRTHCSDQLDEKQIGQSVKLAGWVHRRRDHGGLIFVDLRDRWGLTQVVFDPEGDSALHTAAKELRSEFCISVEGTVGLRPEGTQNRKLKTGTIEIKAVGLNILNTSPTPPFEIAEETDLSEELRLTYRFLDLRRASSARLLRLRHDVVKAMHNFLDEEGFLEVETPILNKSTPEGARDFLVPSRLSPGRFYALPQSPQLFKQILMVAGVERYYQIARCFRDEDLRADRQPEFTQLDLEMSFISEETIYTLMERLFVRVWEKVTGQALEIPFKRMTHAQALSTYGTDKPDLRYGMPLIDVTELFAGTGFKRFSEGVEQGGSIKGIVAPGAAGMSRKELDQVIEWARLGGAGGAVPIQSTESGIVCPVAKYVGEEPLARVIKKMQAAQGDLVILVADQPNIAHAALGICRTRLARQLNLIPGDKHVFAWVTEFPMFRYDKATGCWNSEHHPFTAPFDEDMKILESDPGAVRSRAYDLVLDGVELGSGSIRIHRRDLQEKVFRVLGLPDTEVISRFGFLLNAFQYGAPPHGGVAFGIDRLVALMAGVDSIRDVIPFPKTQKGMDLMIGAPTEVALDQLKEVGLTLKKG